MLDLFLVGFFAMVLVLGLKRPFFWVLLYIYVDSVAPQKMAWGFAATLQLSLIAFLAVVGLIEGFYLLYRSMNVGSC